MSHKKSKNKKKQNKQSSDNNVQSKVQSSPSSSSSSSWSTSFILLAILTVIAYNELQFNLPSITGTVSKQKPYDDIQSFYPYYLKEHSTPECQRMHVFGTYHLHILYTYNIKEKSQFRNKYQNV